MLVLLPFSILLISAGFMAAMRRLRPAFANYWLAALGGASLAWASTWVLRARLPQSYTPLTWRPESLFSVSPELVLDGYSWPFTLALTTLVLAVILTDAQRATNVDWTAWAGSLAIGALGVLAVMAGNPLTLALAWTVIDILELLIVLPRVRGDAARGGLIGYFATSLSGTMLMTWSLLSVNPLAGGTSFASIKLEVSVFLLVAVGLRLGILPLNVIFLSEAPLQRGLGTLLRSVPAAAGLVLLTRTAVVGVPATLKPYLLALIVLTAFYSAVAWLRADDELRGRPYWILGLAAMAMAAAVVAQPAAVLAWSLVLLYGGGLIFLASGRAPRLIPIGILGLLGLSTLPFSPTWPGTSMFAEGLGVFSLGFLIAQALLLLGFVRHALRPEESLAEGERWIWVVYPLGLAMLPLTHWIYTLWLSPAQVVPEAALLWWPGLVASVLAVGFGYLFSQGWRMPAGVFTFLEAIFSLNWFYRLLWRGYRLLGSLLAALVFLFEGEAGVLWTLLVLALLFSVFGQVVGGQ